MALETFFRKQFSFAPTSRQEKFFTYFDAFLASTKPKCTLLLKGYAGTGKTTLISSVINYLKQSNVTCVVLAPTGRAAKVISGYSHQQAFTIHKMIYQRSADKEGTAKISLKQNLFTNTVFIVDESSMIQAEEDNNGYSVTGSLLTDLFQFVFSASNSKLILAGDVAQLPPVGSEKSYALDRDWLRLMHHLTAAEVELTEVMRQTSDSGILFNATSLRTFIETHTQGFRFTLPFPDMMPITALELQEELEKCFDEYGKENVMLITRSNKRANEFNRQVRARLLFYEEELVEGDFMMVVKNNYHWLEGENQTNFIANGDIIQIRKIRGYEEEYGLRFANARVRLVDFDLELECKLCLDTITSEGAGLPSEKSTQLFEELKIAYAGESNRRKMFDKIKQDEYYNALHVKFAYAVTCHKSQGGQWPAVFVDQGYMTEEMVNTEFYRWLYTAITRSTEKVYLVNFHEQFF
ncbi:MAG: ATP-binding domain-containing protein [Bacteroidota bacterium]